MSQAPAPAPTKKSSKTSLFILIGLLVVTAICAYAIPEVLKQIYLAEEEAKRKVNIVGTDSGKELPPGVTRPMPEASNVPGPGSGRRGPGGAAPSVSRGAAPSDATPSEKPADSSAADAKPSDDKPAGDAPAGDKPSEEKPTENATSATPPTEPAAPAEGTTEKP